jgi:chromosome segregation ATPase
VDGEVFKGEIQKLKLEAKTLQERTENSQKELEMALDKLSSMQLQRYEAQRERDQERLWRDNLHHDFEQRGKMIEALRVRIDERDRAIMERESRLAEGGRLLEHQRMDIDSRMVAAEQLKAQIDEQVQKVGEQDAKIEELTGKIGELTGVIEEHKKMIESINEEKEAIDKAKSDLTAECAGLQSTIREMELKQSQEEVLIETVTALELTRDGLKNQISSLESQRGIHELEMADLKKERDGVAAESEKHAAEAKALEAEKAALEAEKENLSIKVSDLEGENGELKTKVEGLEGEKADFDAKIAAADAKVEATNAAADAKVEAITAAADAKVDALTAERDGLKTKTEEQDADIATLRESEAALKAEGEALKSENATLKEEGDNLRVNLAKTTEDLEQMTKRADEQTGRADRLSTECKGLATQLSDANVRLKNLHEMHSQRLDEIEELKGDVKSWKKKATTRPKQEDFVMVRDRENRGAVYVVPLPLHSRSKHGMLK